jgi:hypothetical protein
VVTKTALGAAGDDDDRPLTPEEREALRSALSNPVFAASIKRATDAVEVFNRQIAAGLVTSIAPALERWREQQREIARSIAPMINTQVQIRNVLAPLAEQIERFQQDFAAQLRVAVVAHAEVQSRMASVVAGSEFQEALRRISDIAAVRLSVPTDDGLTRLSDLIEAGEIDEETLDEAEQGVAGDALLSEAVELAAEALSKSRPLLSRKRARQIVVFWVWLMYGGALWAVAVLTNPGVAAVPGALGLPGAPAVAKAVGNKVVPPKEDE